MNHGKMFLGGLKMHATFSTTDFITLCIRLSAELPDQLGRCSWLGSLCVLPIVEGLKDITNFRIIPM
jgi:hypothetical protein